MQTEMLPMSINSDMTHPSIYNLPPEILVKIFQDLDVDDKKVVSQVCKTWRSASHIPSVWKGVLIDLNRKLLSQVQQLNERGIRRFRLIDVDVNQEMLLGLLKAVPNIEVLILYYCGRDSDINLADAFSLKLPKLSHLCIGDDGVNFDDNCLELICRNCPNLVSLVLSNCSKLTDKSLLSIPAGLQKLQSIDLRHCKIISDAGIRNLVCAPNSHSQDLYNTTDTIVYLELGHNITDTGLAYLVSGGRWHVVHLNITSCPDLTNDAMIHIGHMHSLQVLEMSYDGDDISPVGFRHLVARKSRIERLILREVGYFDDSVLEEISQLPFLKYLGQVGSLCWCKITAAGILHLSKYALRIECIEMHRCSVLDGSGMAPLAMIKSLNKLVLVDCNINDESMATMIQCGSQIQQIGMLGCSAVTDTGLKLLVKLPTLTRLDLMNNRCITLACIENVKKENEMLIVVSHSY